MVGDFRRERKNKHRQTFYTQDFCRIFNYTISYLR